MFYSSELASLFINLWLRDFLSTFLQVSRKKINKYQHGWQRRQRLLFYHWNNLLITPFLQHTSKKRKVRLISMLYSLDYVLNPLCSLPYVTAFSFFISLTIWTMDWWYRPGYLISLYSSHNRRRSFMECNCSKF